MKTYTTLLIFGLAALATVSQAQWRGDDQFEGRDRFVAPDRFVGKWIVADIHSDTGNPRIGTPVTIWREHRDHFVLRFHDSPTKYQMVWERNHLRTEPGQAIGIRIQPAHGDGLRFEVRYSYDGPVKKSGYLRPDL